MRKFIFIFFTICILKAKSQSFVVYKDIVNQFSINIPVGWKYGINKNYPALILLAQRTPLSPADTVRDNFNMNVIATPKKNLDKTFADFIKYLPDAKKYKLIDTGSKTFNGTKFMWLIETHESDIGAIQLHNYDFVALKNGKAYILTMVTFSYYFDIIKPLFDKIANSFSFLY